MIDLHTHLLPAVDDGVRTLAGAASVLRRFADDGVRLVVCTPHLRASDVARAPEGTCAAAFAALAAAAPEELRLARGWEIMLDEPGVDLRGSTLALGGSNAVLVEFPSGAPPVHAERELFRISMSGLVPIVAHPERYRGCTPAMVRAWRRAGAAMQLDAASLLGDGPRAALSAALLEEGLIDVMASDNHGDGRALAPAVARLVAGGAAAAAELLTRTNPERLLRNESLLPVPPVRIDRPWLARLRHVLGARRSTN